jgi:hypothetical protein
VGPADRPDDEERVDEPDEGRGALDGRLLARRGVGKAEVLLQIAKADFDGPALGIALENLAGIQREVGAEEDSQRELPVGDAHDDDAEQTRAARPVPLRVDHLVVDRLLLAVEGRLRFSPWHGRVAGEHLRLGQYRPAHSRPPVGMGLLRARRSGQHRVRAHRAEDGEAYPFGEYCS